MDELEVEIIFTDLTLCEANGVYEDVAAIMEKESPGSTDWMLRSTMTMDSMYGLATFILHLDYGGAIRIATYMPSSGNTFYNPDMQILSVWAQENGWEIPQPHRDLVSADIEFWKHHWETNLVGSDYLDEMFGEIGYGKDPDEDEDEDEL